jgi:hypothetical protein
MHNSKTSVSRMPILTVSAPFQSASLSFLASYMPSLAFAEAVAPRKIWEYCLGVSGNFAP